jgi:WhiB family transcriptional regulator, redox-sensing transcriptional regulator
MTIPYIPAQRSAVPVATDWRAHAACSRADPRIFFPAGTGAASLVQVERAKQVCAGCPVRIPCLDWALATGRDVGVWGGTAADERRALRAHRARALPGLWPSAARGVRYYHPGQFDPRGHAQLAEDLAQVVVDRVP